MESSYHGIITPQCVDKMLSNYTFVETRIQGLLDGLIFVKKGLSVHVQHMLKMSRGLYTGGNFKQNTWKKRGKIGDLVSDHDLTNLRFGANYFFIKIYYAIFACTTTTFTFRKC